VGDKKRLFLAVNLDIAVTRKIGDAAARMRQAAERRGIRVSWVPPVNLHVTLKFLGWTAAEAVMAIRDTIRDAVAARRPFEIAARGAGAFPSEASPRVLWIGLTDPDGSLAALARLLEDRMVGLGFTRESRPFSGHVTVGRVKEGKGAEDVLAPFRHTDFGTSLIREAVLYESTTKSTGSEYTALARWELLGASVGPERQTREVREEDKDSEDVNGRPA
jgi:RNA 2',3'-cyclic 3'-phosphodiesterase